MTRQNIVCSIFFSKKKSCKNGEIGKIRVCKTLKYWDENIESHGRSSHLDLSMHNLELQ